MKKELMFIFIFFITIIIFDSGIFVMPTILSCSAHSKLLEEIQTDTVFNKDNKDDEGVNSSPKIAIVIDDFGGYVRDGVKEMLSLDIPITCAIMPKVEFSTMDAELAHTRGHEVILHMPMEANCYMPDSWYGNICIRCSDSEEEATEKVKECLKNIPHCVGMNIHIGSGACQNKKLMKSVISTAKEGGYYFLDSVTDQNSVCEEVACDLAARFVKRFEFLEKAGKHSYDYAKKVLLDACRHAKKYGSAIVIGHVGTEGGRTTYQAIKDSIDEIQACGIELVKLSQVIK